MNLGRAALLGAALAAAPATAAPAEVRVAGDPLPGPASRDATASSSVVQGERLRAAGTSTAEVLARVPGVQVTRTGAVSDLATAALRGATAAETPVYLAGIRLNDDVTGIADLSTVPPHLLARVEVYRGASPFDSDRAGLGGAILLEPRSPRDTELSAGGSLGSFGERGAFLAGGAAGPRAASLVALRRDGATNDYPFEDRSGRISRRGNADFTASDAWALGRLSLPGGGRLTTLAHAYDREQGTPGFAVVPDDRARTHTRLLLGGLSARLPCDGGGGERCAVDAVLTRLDSTAVLTDPARSLDPTGGAATRGDRSELALRGRFAVSGSAWLRSGVTLARDSLRVERTASAVAAERVTARPALGGELAAGQATRFVALAALECHADARSAECTAFEPTARLGARHELAPGLALRANAGRYVRVPTLGERGGASAVVRGNPRLGSEIGLAGDLGAEASSRGGAGAVRAEVSAFARRASDLIAYRRTSLGAATPYNVGEARVLGLELAGAAETLRALRAEASFTFLDARDVTPGRTLTNALLPFRSPGVLSLRVEVFRDRALPLAAIDEVALGAVALHRGARYADEAGLLRLPPQSSVDLEARALFAARRLALRATVKNVSAARLVDAVGLPLPGRSFHASVEGRL